MPGMPTIIGGVRALLMQTLHPGVLAGVHDHSNFREDTLGRLARTTAWIHALTYGSTAEAQAATARVIRLHESVTGKYVDGGGNVREYSANDPELLRWVHITFTDSFLRAHELWGGTIPGGPDAYVREWAQAGRLMGVEFPPESKAALERELGKWLAAGILRGDDRVAETVAFIRDPPLHPLLRPGYQVLFEAAILSLEPEYRRLLGLHTARLGPLCVRPVSSSFCPGQCQPQRARRPPTAPETGRGLAPPVVDAGNRKPGPDEVRTGFSDGGEWGI
jgi:uncharacterized protein (DUF2236 family)